MSLELEEPKRDETDALSLRASPEELALIRARTPVMRPLAELLGGPAEPASPEELRDLEEWLAEREKTREHERRQFELRMSGIQE